MKSTGTKIRTMAGVVEFAGIILTLFLAISTWVTGCDSKSHRSSYSSYYSSYYSSSSSSDETTAGITGAVILVVGIFSSICSGILIDGFGELVENSMETKQHLKQLTESQMTEKKAEDIIKKYNLDSRKTTKNNSE